MSLSLVWRHQTFVYVLPKEVLTIYRRKNHIFKMWRFKGFLRPYKWTSPTEVSPENNNVWHSVISVTLNLILRQFEYCILLKGLFNTDFILISCIICIVNNITNYDEWRHFRTSSSWNDKITDAYISRIEFLLKVFDCWRYICWWKYIDVT